MKKNKLLTVLIIIAIVISVLYFSFVIYTRIEDTLDHTAYKPVIYLYPEKEMKVSVKLGHPEKITSSYPLYEDGWDVVAKPDGGLKDLDTGRELYSLYWEGKHNYPTNLDTGFIVERNSIIPFLEEKLELLGLNEREAEEFIIYWLPKLQENKYNFINFVSLEDINNNMPLEVSPKPDTMIRIMMQFKGLDKKIKVNEQRLVTPEREGFTLVEWGGTVLK